MVELIIRGKPVGNNTLGRVGKTKGGKNIVFMYKPPHVKAYKKLIQAHVIEYCMHTKFIPFNCPVAMTLYIYLPIPKSWSKKLREEALAVKYAPVKPDNSNMLKIIEDALCKDKDNPKFYLLEDDKLICKTLIYKYYAVDVSYIKIELEKL